MIKGCDLSRWNTIHDWEAIKAQGVQFVYAKATQGETLVDIKFSDHLLNARKAGLLIGAYHFCECSLDPVKQANHFWERAKLFNLNLPPAMDLESSSAQGLSAEHVKEFAWAFLTELAKLSSRIPIWYGGASFLHSLQIEERFKSTPLWLAEYGAIARVPHPWSKYTLWQFSDKGVNGNLDTDRFDGKLEELKAL